MVGMHVYLIAYNENPFSGWSIGAYHRAYRMTTVSAILRGRIVMMRSPFRTSSCKVLGKIVHLGCCEVFTNDHSMCVLNRLSGLTERGQL